MAVVSAIASILRGRPSPGARPVSPGNWAEIVEIVLVITSDWMGKGQAGSWIIGNGGSHEDQY
jgi:hypothetical protein